MMFRSPKLLRLAKESFCMCCLNRYDTVVPAHSNWQEHGKGAGLKAHDCFVAFLCHRCHGLIDGRIPGMTPDERKDKWRTAHDRTLLWMFQEGHLQVKG